ncbi:MAG: hypothetical protein ACR2P1_04230 [Pseudomonadales bacterium]
MNAPQIEGWRSPHRFQQTDIFISKASREAMTGTLQAQQPAAVAVPLDQAVICWRE